MDKFKSHYPEWAPAYDSERIVREIHDMQKNLLQENCG